MVTTNSPVRAAAAVFLLAGIAHAFQSPSIVMLRTGTLVTRSSQKQAVTLRAPPKQGLLAAKAQMVTREVIREGDGATFPQEGKSYAHTFT